MKTLLILSVLLILTLVLVAQKTDCNCPANTITHNGKPDKVFKFSNGETLAICGYSEIQQKQKVLSEFLIYQCEKYKIIETWDATQICTIEKYHDTLIVEKFYNIANGKDMSLKWTKFYKKIFYWKQSQLSDTAFFINDLRKYSLIEINKALFQFKNLKKKYKSENILLVGDRLFWAYVSGNKIAGTYLEKLNEKFGPFNGEIAEEYNSLIATYKQYKKTTTALL